MRLSRVLTVAAVAAAGILTLSGCNCNECADDTNKTSAGMVGEKKAGCCSEGKAQGECKDATGAGASMGAVSEKKEGCCKAKASATN